MVESCDERSRLAARFLFGGQDIPWQLGHWARHRGDHPFLVWDPLSGNPRQWTYAGFLAAARSVAAGLHARGIGPGDRVLLHSDNCPEMVMAWFGCAIAGATAVTTNTGSVAGELARAAHHAGVRAAITQPRYASLVARHVRGLEWLAVTGSNSDGSSRDDDAAREGEPFDRFLRDPSGAPQRAADPLLAAGILYTSGTTSLPKAVVHTHANWLWAARNGPRAVAFGPGDVHLAHLPFFHTNAQLWAVATACGAGGSVLLLPKPTVSRFWDVIGRHRVTHMTATAHLLRSVEPPPGSLEHRMKVVQGGAGSLLRRFAAAAGAKPLVAYGMSETVSYTVHTDVLHAWPEDALGRPAAGYEVQVRDVESGEVAALDAPGELWVRGIRGVQLFSHYHDNEEANAKAFAPGGWLRTGDIVKQGDDGLLYFLDRDKDRLRVGGENVSATEVEAVIARVPEVREVAVVAASDPRLDAVPVAFVVAMQGADPAALRRSILARCEDALSAFKRPRQVYFLDDLPRALLGKIAKHELRRMAEELRQRSQDGIR